MAKKKGKQSYKNEIIAIAILALALLLTFILYTQGDAGVIGGFTYRLLASLFGSQGSYVIVTTLVIIAFTHLFYKENLNITKYLSILFIITSILALIHMFSIPNHLYDEAYKHGLEGLGGGIVGGIIVSTLSKAFGEVGTYILLITVLTIGFLLFTGLSIVNIFKTFFTKISDFIKFATKGIKKKNANKITSTQSKHQELIIENPQYNYKKTSTIEEESDPKEPSSDMKENEKIEIDSIVTEEGAYVPDLSLIEQKKIENLEKDLDSDLDNEDKLLDESKSEEKLHLVAPDQSYELPSIDLLNDPEVKSLDSQQFLRQQAYKIEETLSNFKIDARVIKVSVGPTITRFELQIAAGVKVSKVSSLENDIALSLAVKSIRIEAPIPGKSAIGIEVPNETTNIVLLKEVLMSEEFEASKEGISVGLGFDISGNPVISKINELPHLLIAGATGSGKSVCINTIINAILLTKKPHQVKFVLIDPKRVELNIYEEIPHLLTPVVTDPQKAAQVLMWVVQEMEKRYQLLAKKGVRNITQYNKKIKTSEDEFKELPFVVIIIDELADLMMVASKDVEDSICRIAQMGRAAGIHLVVGTQRPSVDVITGLIKANIPARVAFAVSSSVDSRTILDMSGAERLLGNGDMLYLPPGLNKPIRVQGSFVSEKEINRIVDFIRDQKSANYAKENFVKSQDGASSALKDRDELFEDALLEFIEYGSASISLLQRRLRIGYTRAARIVDQLEEAGAISGYAGSQPRDVLMTSELVQSLLNENN